MGLRTPVDRLAVGRGALLFPSRKVDADLLPCLGLAIHFPGQKPRLRVAVISPASCHKHPARVRPSDASRFALLNLGTQWTGALVRPRHLPRNR